jgi:hypothetical protein
VSNKETEALLRKARKAGAVVERSGSGHYRVSGPLGTVTMGVSSSCVHALRKQKKDLRRIGIELQ